MTAKKGLCAFSVDKGTLEWQHGFGDERIEYAPNLAVTDSTILCGAECLYAFASTCELSQNQRTTGEVPLPVEEETETSDILPSKHRKTVMVSVVCYYDLLPQYLQSLGFTKADRIDIGEVVLEVTGGYSSYLRGDEDAGGSHASVFAGCSYEFSPDTGLRKGPISFGMHTHKNRSQMLGDCPIGHFVGPEDDVFELLQHIIGDPWAELHLGSFPGDLEVASLWWTDRRYVRDCTGMGDAKG